VCCPSKVTKHVVAWIAIKMRSLHPRRTRTNERFEYKSVNELERRLSLPPKLNLTVGKVRGRSNLGWAKGMPIVPLSVSTS
jgi:hypothetical protein